MQRNPHRYQIATSYRTSCSLRLVSQPIKRNLSFFYQKEQKDKAEYVLLFFCLKNVIKKYVFCPENSVKLCALRIEPVKMI